MPRTSNLSPWHRPPTPSLNNGPVQRRIRRAFIGTGKPVLSTAELMRWTHPRPGGNTHNHRRAIRGAAERYCERVGRASTVGRPILWKLKQERAILAKLSQVKELTANIYSTHNRMCHGEARNGAATEKIASGAEGPCGVGRTPRVHLSLGDKGGLSRSNSSCVSVRPPSWFWIFSTHSPSSAQGMPLQAKEPAGAFSWRGRITAFHFFGLPSTLLVFLGSYRGIQEANPNLAALYNGYSVKLTLTFWTKPWYFIIRW